MKPASLFLAVAVLCPAVRPDYPPPSEDGHDYYSRRQSGAGSIPPRPGVGSFIGDWSSKEWSVLNNQNQGKCLDIPANLTLCQKVGYEQMRLPNLLEHDTLKEVTQQAASWVRLLQVKCHQDTQIFLCSLFAPVCFDQTIWPCQSLCEAVKAGCEDKMLKYGFPWPDMLRCDQYPAGDELCIGPRNEQETENKNSVCYSCTHDSSYEAILSSFCRAEFVMRINVEQSLVTGNDLKIVASKKKKVYRSGSLKAKELRDGVLFIEGGAKCDCPKLETKPSGHFIILGSKSSNRWLNVSTLLEVDNSKGLRRALRDIRKKDICKTATGGNSTELPPNKGSIHKVPGVGKGRKKLTQAQDKSTSGEKKSAKGHVRDSEKRNKISSDKSVKGATKLVQEKSGRVKGERGGGSSKGVAVGEKRITTKGEKGARDRAQGQAAARPAKKPKTKPGSP